MDENYFQGDLFNEKILEKKKNRPRIFEKYSQQRVLSFIRLPIEYVVIFSIAVLILMIVSYAIGVERGKSLGRTGHEILEEDINADVIMPLEENKVEETGVEAVETPVVEKEPEIFQVDKPADENNAVPGGNEETAETPAVNGDSEEIDAGTYIVQLASYRSFEYVKREMKNLENEGIRSGWKKSGDWYQLFARGFETVSEAKKARNNLIRIYKDCYIKKVR